MEPVGPLRDFVVDQKRHVEQQLPGQTYCGHPPHATLVVAPYENERDLAAALEDAVDTTGPLDVSTLDMHVFYDDAMAGGGHTVVVRAHLSLELQSLQHAVAHSLRAYLAPAQDDRASSQEWPREFQESLDRYGFPFVGAHWIPHFSIASLQVSKNDPLLQELIGMAAEFSFRLSEISLWRVEGDLHEKLLAVKLGGAAPCSPLSTGE
jgi:hypothetical protein